MKRIYFLIVALMVVNFCIVGQTFGAAGKKPNVSVEVTASEGVTVERVKELPIEFPVEKITTLLVAPKVVRDIALRKGEWEEISFQIFAPDFEETTINLIALNDGKPTPMVRIITAKVAITKDNDFMAYPRIVVLQPKEGAKRKNHIVLQFLSEDKVLATADIFVRLPLAEKYFSVNVDRGEEEEEENEEGLYYTQLSVGVGVRTRSTDTSIGWRGNVEDQEDEGGWYFNFNCWFH